MTMDENKFDQYLAIVQSDASDVEVEMAASELGIELDNLNVDQSHRLRDARLERARGKAVESALKRKDADSFGELGGGIGAPVCETPKKGHGLGFVLILFVVIAVLSGAALYFFVFSGETCRTKCCDGTCSPSVGQGTCSYHGGICNDK